jgi:hypothetical protein
VVVARVVVTHVAVRRYGLPLATLATRLRVSKQGAARALERGTLVLSRRDWMFDQWLDSIR